MQNTPVKFDVENIIKTQVAPSMVGTEGNMVIPQSNIPIVNAGSRTIETFPNFSLLMKSELFNLCSNILGNSLCVSSPKPPVQEEKLEETLSSSIRLAVSDSLSAGNSSDVKIRGSLTISTDGRRPLILTFTDGTGRNALKTGMGATPSKRKAYQPVKYTGSTPSPDSSCSSTVNPAHLSGYTTPSVPESCALDLSKGFSSAPSAQLTPLKVAQTPVVESSPFNPMVLLQQSSLLNLYNTQQNIFGSTTTALPNTVQDTGGIPSLPPKRKRPGPANVRRSSSTRQFACNQCEEVFGSLQDLEEHTTSVHGAYRCHICNAKFTQRSNLQRHALKHVGFKPFECGLCERAYFRKDHLMRHMETTHPGIPARANIRVRLTSSESLDYLSRVIASGNSLDVKLESGDDEKDVDKRESPLSEVHPAEALATGSQSVGSEDTTKSPEPFAMEPNPIEQEEVVLLADRHSSA